MSYSTKVVRPERAGGGTLTTHVQASCTCGWVGVMYPTHTIEGYTLAERDATKHYDRHERGLCRNPTHDGNRDDPTTYYCGNPRNHAADCGNWEV